MKLYKYRGHAPNFGDELNSLVWPRLFPTLFDEDESEIFLGIGSILFDDHRAGSKKWVFGSGFGGYTNKPNLHDASWKVSFVRGPLTALELGLDRSMAVSDSGILIRALWKQRGPMKSGVSFMPHWSSMGRGDWPRACALAGVRLIDPRLGVTEILGQMLSSTVVMAEAMHGAIIADALRVPWIPITPLEPVNRMKWTDWAQSLELHLEPHFALPSSLKELKLTSLPKNRVLSKAVSLLDESSLSRSVNSFVAERCAKRLDQIARTEPQLSRESVLDERIDQMLDRLSVFARERGVPAPLLSPLDGGQTCHPPDGTRYGQARSDG